MKVIKKLLRLWVSWGIFERMAATSLLKTYDPTCRRGCKTIWRLLAKFSELGLAIQGANFMALPRMSSGYDLIVDAGANDGQWAKFVLHHLHPKRLVCFEPGNAAFSRLTQNLEHLPQVELYQKALGRKPEQRPLRIILNTDDNGDAACSFYPLSPETAKIYNYPFSEVRQEIVTVTTLDSEFSRGNVIDLLKIDTQGSEYEILEGGHETLKRVKTLMIELLFFDCYEGAVQFPELHNYIKSFGFNLWGLSRVARGRDGELLDVDAVYRRLDDV